MDDSVEKRYMPLYPTNLANPDQAVQSFIINFYRLSDNPENDERWVGAFSEDAQVQIGADTAHGVQGE